MDIPDSNGIWVPVQVVCDRDILRDVHLLFSIESILFGYLELYGWYFMFYLINNALFLCNFNWRSVQSKDRHEKEIRPSYYLLLVWVVHVDWLFTMSLWWENVVLNSTVSTGSELLLISIYLQM